MHIRVDTTPAELYSIKAMKRVRRRYTARFRIAYIVLFLCGVALLAAGLFDHNASMLVISIVYLVLPFVLFGLLHVVYRSQAAETRRAAGQGAVTITLSDDGVHIVNPNTEQIVSWRAFKRFAEDNHWWMLQLTWVSAIVLPKSLFTSDQQATLRTFLAAKPWEHATQETAS